MPVQLIKTFPEFAIVSSWAISPHKFKISSLKCNLHEQSFFFSQFTKTNLHLTVYLLTCNNTHLNKLA